MGVGQGIQTGKPKIVISAIERMVEGITALEFLMHCAVVKKPSA